MDQSRERIRRIPLDGDGAVHVDRLTHAREYNASSGNSYDGEMCDSEKIKCGRSVRRGEVRRGEVTANNYTEQTYRRDVAGNKNIEVKTCPRGNKRHRAGTRVAAEITIDVGVLCTGTIKYGRSGAGGGGRIILTGPLPTPLPLTNISLMIKTFISEPWTQYFPGHVTRTMSDIPSRLHTLNVYTGSESTTSAKHSCDRDVHVNITETFAKVDICQSLFSPASAECRLIYTDDLWNSYHPDVPLPSRDAKESRSPNNTHLSIRAYSYDSTEYSSNIKIVDEKFDSRKYVRQESTGVGARGEGATTTTNGPPAPLVRLVHSQQSSV
ncbi:unnamed protein product [Danaus chrysippus]|uniref:(African queen) hypothetical protein n=1 Tax=Danaus chrysippus TaxID=151541 RepID=A0A8J2VSJ4_9NEOP|nr:unnamed protein product [Danaus chrysippus]